MDVNTMVVIGLAGLGTLTTIIGYFLKGTMDEIKTHRDKFANLHREYVQKDDFRDFKDELWKKLDELKQDIKAKE